MPTSHDDAGARAAHAPTPRGLAGLYRLLVVAVLGFWYVQWQGRYVAPVPDAGADRPAVQQLARQGDGAAGLVGGRDGPGAAQQRRHRGGDDD